MIVKFYSKILAVFLLATFVAIGLVASPYSAKNVAAFDKPAIPRPTPPDQEAIDAFIEQLKDTLPDAVGDEDAVNSIIERWDRRNLSGKTKKQIIDLLFADVKAVVKNNKEVRDAVWDSWSDAVAEAAAEEEEEAPAAPSKGKAQEEDSTQVAKTGWVNGKFVISDQSRRIGFAELQTFLTDVYKQAKVWSNPDKRQYRGQSYAIYFATEPADANVRSKSAAIDKAVKAVVDNGFVLPYDLRFYCIGEAMEMPDGSKAFVQNRAFKRGDNWAPIAYISLADSGSTPLAKPKPLSDTAANFNGFETLAIRTIHEIGHIIHERQAGDVFWQLGKTADKNISSKVSPYAAAGSEKEFVAEVFAGLVIGKRWPNDVLAEYRKWHGPVPALF